MDGRENGCATTDGGVGVSCCLSSIRPPSECCFFLAVEMCGVFILINFSYLIGKITVKWVPQFNNNFRIFL